MDLSRISQPCWFQQHHKFRGWRRGTLHAWSTDYKQFDSGPGLVPVGVIECHETARVYSVYAGCISFSELAPED